MVVVLLAFLKIQTWLLLCCHLKKKKNSAMVVVLLAFLKAQIWLLSYWRFFFKRPRYGYCPTSFLKAQIWSDPFLRLDLWLSAG